MLNLTSLLIFECFVEETVIFSKRMREIVQQSFEKEETKREKEKRQRRFCGKDFVLLFCCATNHQIFDPCFFDLEQRGDPAKE